MKSYKICKFWIFLIIFAFFFGLNSLPSSVASASNNNLSLSSKSAILVDFDTGKIIFEKNANERLQVASMTKLASLSVVFDYLNKGIIKENDYVCVSEHAGGVGGSSAFLDAGSKYKVTDLIKTVVIASANDSMVALAEFVAGSEEGFVQKMNLLCGSLNLNNTHFENATGLPTENHYSSAYDMVKIYKQVCDNNLYKKYCKIWMDDFIHPSGRKTGLVNTNRLVKTYDGIDGGKTGYTDKARFCLTASATRGSTRLIGVVIGSNDSKTRFAEMSKMFNFGFASFENKLLINNETPITVHKFKNAKKQVSLFPENNVKVFLEKNQDFEFSTDYEIYEMKAPIKQGDVVGKIFVFDKNNMVIDEANIVVNEFVEEVGFKENLDKVIFKW